MLAFLSSFCICELWSVVCPKKSATLKSLVKVVVLGARREEEKGMVLVEYGLSKV